MNAATWQRYEPPSWRDITLQEQIECAKRELRVLIELRDEADTPAQHREIATMAAIVHTLEEAARERKAKAKVKAKEKGATR